MKVSRKRLWKIAIGAVIAIGLYVGSLPLILLGQRTEQWEWARRLNIDYVLNGPEWGRDGIQFVEQPWMIVYRPICRPVHARSSDPDEKVSLNAWGKLIHASYYYGACGYSWSEAVKDAEGYRGWTYAETFPERFPNLKTSVSSH